MKMRRAWSDQGEMRIELRVRGGFLDIRLLVQARFTRSYEYSDMDGNRGMWETIVTDHEIISYYDERATTVSTEWCPVGRMSLEEVFCQLVPTIEWDDKPVIPIEITHWYSPLANAWMLFTGDLDLAYDSLINNDNVVWYDLKED